MNIKNTILYVGKVIVSAALLASLAACAGRNLPNQSIIYRVPSIQQELSAEELKRIKKKESSEKALTTLEQRSYPLFEELYQTQPILAEELGKIPEFQDDVSGSEVKALEDIVKLVDDIDFPSDFAKKEKDVHIGQLENKVFISWGYNGEKSVYDGYFPVGTQGSRMGAVQTLGAQPYKFEAGDRITNKVLNTLFVKWESSAGAGDIDGVIVNIGAKKDEELVLQLGTNFIKFKPQDLYTQNLILYDGQVKISLLKDVLSENESKVGILEDMVLLGKEKIYSPLLQALFWDYQDNIFNEQNNPLENYKGHIAFIEKTWGDMKGPSVTLSRLRV